MLVESTVDDNGVGRLRLAHPQRRNALGHEVVGQALEAVQYIEENAAGAAVLSAAAPVFCAGADRTEWGTGEPGHPRPGVRLIETIALSPILWIAEVEGPVLGFGVALVGACAIRLAAVDVTFSLPEWDLGLFPSVVLELLRPTVQPRIAFDWALSGRRVSAEEALRAGLLTQICPSGGVHGAVAEWVDRIMTPTGPLPAAQIWWRQHWASARYEKGRRS